MIVYYTDNDNILYVYNYSIFHVRPSFLKKPTVRVEVCGYSSVGKTTLIQQLMTSDYLGDPSHCFG